MENIKKIFFNLSKTFVLFLFLHIFCFISLKSMSETANLFDPHNFSARFYIYEKPIFCLNLAKDFSVFFEKGQDLWEKRIAEIQTNYTALNDAYKNPAIHNKFTDKQAIRDKYYKILLSLIEEVNNVCKGIQLQILKSLSNRSNFDLSVFFREEYIESLKIKISTALNQENVFTNIEKLIGEINDMYENSRQMQLSVLV
ncbi:hypothetical protein K9M16_03280 [Candidatus Babeliales bacterium]|nr:hypothetical protein [Candidatus Babeliales bacterium]